MICGGLQWQVRSISYQHSSNGPGIKMAKEIVRRTCESQHSAQTIRLTGSRGKNDLLEPGIMRSLCNIDAVKVLTGPSANYAIILDSKLSTYLDALRG